jgi:hypothetical protein
MTLASVMVFYSANGRIKRRDVCNLLKLNSLNKLEVGAYYKKSVLSNSSL